MEGNVTIGEPACRLVGIDATYIFGSGNNTEINGGDVFSGNSTSSLFEYALHIPMDENATLFHKGDLIFAVTRHERNEAGEELANRYLEAYRWVEDGNGTGAWQKIYSRTMPEGTEIRGITFNHYNGMALPSMIVRKEGNEYLINAFPTAFGLPLTFEIPIQDTLYGTAMREHGMDNGTVFGISNEFDGNETIYNEIYKAITSDMANNKSGMIKFDLRGLESGDSVQFTPMENEPTNTNPQNPNNNIGRIPISYPPTTPSPGSTTTGDTGTTPDSSTSDGGRATDSEGNPIDDGGRATDSVYD